MLIRLLGIIVALIILVLLLRSIYRDAAEKLREFLYRRRARKLLGVEEPKARVERTRDRIILRVSLPDVASASDVSIRKLRSSIEVKAYGENKLYFKLFPIPRGARLLSKRMVEKEYIIELSAEER
jgi:hypothetical protein